MEVFLSGFLAVLLLSAVGGSSFQKPLKPYDYMNIIRIMSKDLGMPEQQVIDELKDMFSHKNMVMQQKRSLSPKCVLCTTLTTAISVVTVVPSDDLILSVVSGLCTGLNIFSDPVCEYTIETQGDIILDVARKLDAEDKLYKKLQELCSVFLDADCEDNKGDEWLVELPDVPKPPVEPIPQPEDGKPTLKVLQISDLHLDPIYTPGSSTDCGDPICCRGEVIGEPGSGSSGNAGTWGTYEDCDTPSSMITHMLEHIQNTHTDIDYVFWIGDGSAHDFWLQNQTTAMENMALANSLIKKGLPGMKIFPTIGNHDSFPMDNFPPKLEEFAGHELFDISWLIEGTWSDWTTDWLSTELKNDKDFFYSLQLYPGLKLIALNSNYFYALNWWNMYYPDINGQFAWLVKELQAAEDAGDKVHLLIHHPPGADALKTNSHNFWRIVHRYESTIRGMFSGHTHNNEFQVMFDDEDPERAIAMAYVAPSVTTYHDNNPAYRIYTIDGNYEGSTFAVLDYEDYYMDLIEANAGTPAYKRLYSPKEAFGMESLNPQDWKEVVDKFIADEGLFNNFYEYWHRRSPTAPPCDGNCRHDMICYLVRPDTSNFHQCDQVPDF